MSVLDAARAGRTDAEELIHPGADHQGAPDVGCWSEVSDLVRQHGVTETTLYRWKKKYGGMQVSDARRLKALESAVSDASGTRLGVARPAQEAGAAEAALGLPTADPGAATSARAADQQDARATPLPG